MLVSLVLEITVMEKVCGNSVVTIIENTTSGFFWSSLFVLCCYSAVVILGLMFPVPVCILSFTWEGSGGGGGGRDT